MTTASFLEGRLAQAYLMPTIPCTQMPPCAPLGNRVGGETKGDREMITTPIGYTGWYTCPLPQGAAPQTDSVLCTQVFHTSAWRICGPQAAAPQTVPGMTAIPICFPLGAQAQALVQVSAPPCPTVQTCIQTWNCGLQPHTAQPSFFPNVCGPTTWCGAPPPAAAPQTATQWLCASLPCLPQAAAPQTLPWQTALPWCPPPAYGNGPLAQAQVPTGGFSCPPCPTVQTCYPTSNYGAQAQLSAPPCPTVQTCSPTWNCVPQAQFAAAASAPLLSCPPCPTGQAHPLFTTGYFTNPCICNAAGAQAAGAQTFPTVPYAIC